MPPLAQGVISSRVTPSLITMMKEGPCDRDQPLSSPSSDVKTDKSMGDSSRCDNSDMGNVNATEGFYDDQSQGLPVLQASSPYFSPVTTPPVEALPIRPFPLLDFLESHELTVLLASLEDSDEGTFHICHLIIHLLRTVLFPYPLAGTELLPLHNNTSSDIEGSVASYY